MITGFAHIALYTPCLEQTVRFYQETFSAEVFRTFDQPHKGCHLSIAGDLLEVFESSSSGNNGLFKHIAISCDDVDAYYCLALAHGGQGYVLPKDIIFPCPARIAFVKGPSGEQIELFAAKSL